MPEASDTLAPRDRRGRDPGQLILVSGKSIEHVLERASWAMIVSVFVFLLGVNVFCVPGACGLTRCGAFTPRSLPQGIDFALLGLFAATAGSEGWGTSQSRTGSATRASAWAPVGSISGALSEEQSSLSPVGYVCEPTPENSRRWRTWWAYARLDQQLLWGLGCFFGMFFNVNLAKAIVPVDAEVSGYAVGAFQRTIWRSQFWSGLWLLTLLNGFWILFSTHLGNTDCLVRTATDVLWAGSPRMQRYSASRVYAVLLAILTAWAAVRDPSGECSGPVQDPGDSGESDHGDRGDSDFAGEHAVSSAGDASRLVAEDRARAVHGRLRRDLNRADDRHVPLIRVQGHPGGECKGQRPFAAGGLARRTLVG